MHNFHPPHARENRCTTSIHPMLGKTDAKIDHTSRGPTQSVRSASTDAQLPQGKCARRARSERTDAKHHGLQERTKSKRLEIKERQWEGGRYWEKSKTHSVCDRNKKMFVKQNRRNTLNDISLSIRVPCRRTKTGAQTCNKQNRDKNTQDSC